MLKRTVLRIIVLSAIYTCLQTANVFAADAGVLFYYEGLCYEVIYDENGIDTGTVQVGYPDSNTIGGADSQSQGEIIVPESIVINDNTYVVTRVDDLGFRGQYYMESITLPSSVTEIGERAFEGCEELSSITAGCETIYVKYNAFAESKWLASQNDDFVTLNSTLVAYQGNAAHVDIPSGIKVIGEYVFHEYLKSVTLPETLERIGRSAFLDCNKLTSIIIPGSVKVIEDSAFLWCSSLSNVTLSEGLVTIGASAFENTRIKALKLPNSVVEVKKAAFSGCDELVDLKLNNGLKEIGYEAFAYSAIKQLNIPKSVEVIHGTAFTSCKSLVSVTFGDGVKKIDESAFEDCEKLNKVVIPASVNYIAYNAFKDTKWENSLKDEFCIINNMLIKYNGKSKTVKIPSGVKKIMCTFSDTIKIEKVTFPSSLNEIGPYAFAYCRLKEITIPSSVKVIGVGAFQQNGLKKLIINNGVTSIGDLAFESNSLTSVTIPKSVRSIGEEAFKYNDITTVKFNEGLEYIGEDAFYNCNIQKFELPSTVKRMDYSVLDKNYNLKSIKLSKNMRYIPRIAYYSTFENVTEYIIPNGIMAVSCLYDYPKLKTIELPDTLITIRANTFSGSNIESIYIPEGTNWIDGYAFSECKKLKEVSIPDSVKYIEDESFWMSENVVFRCNENSVAYEYAKAKGIKVVGPYISK